MKKMKKVLALMLAMVMALAMGVTVFATGQEGTTTASTHTITISNTDQNVSHTYEAYQVFSGNLDQDGQGTKLGNIAWGSGVKGDDLLAALKASTDANLKATAAITVAEAVGTEGQPGYVPAKVIAVGESFFKYCESAADVAQVISGFDSTGKYKADGSVNAADGGVSLPAGAIDAFAAIVAANLNTKAADFTEGTGANAKTYTATVSGDGYYFIKDVTADLTANDGTTASDTASKYLLAVVKDTEIVAKDTGITPDKKIKDGDNKVAADSAAIGDTVNFEVTVQVPNTKKYVDHFIFDMQDKLPAGITFTGITEVKVDTKTLADASKTTPNHTAQGYDGTDGFYTLKLGATPAVPTITDGKYPWEAANYDAVAAAGGQQIKLVFNEFKKFVEKNDLIGKTITVTYTGVVNDDAEYKATANENEVKFEYSNDPNHDYDGDEPGSDDVVGITPESKTRTYTTSLKIKKVDESGNPLANAIFTLEGTALNRTVLTGVKYEKAPYTASGLGETVGTTSYWKLKDGSYTTTDPGTLTNTSKYENTQETYVQVTYSTVEVKEKETTINIATNAQGIAEFVGLNAGEYTLKETAAPDGYNKIDGTSNITIAWEDPEAISEDGLSGDALTAAQAKKAQGGFTFTATDFAEKTAWNATDKQFEVTIKNQSGTQLPSTGGIGTTIFYIIGTLLVLGAGIMLVTKRRMRVQ